MVAGRDAGARSVQGEGAAEDGGKLLACLGRSRDRAGGQVRGEERAMPASASRTSASFPVTSGVLPAPGGSQNAAAASIRSASSTQAASRCGST